MAWGIASLPGGGAIVNSSVLVEVRWATDYLMACFGNATLVTQVSHLTLHAYRCIQTRRRQFAFVSMHVYPYVWRLLDPSIPNSSDTMPARALGKNTLDLRLEAHSAQEMSKVHWVMHLHHHVLWPARPPASHWKVSMQAAAHELPLLAARWAAQQQSWLSGPGQRT